MEPVMGIVAWIVLGLGAGLLGNILKYRRRGPLDWNSRSRASRRPRPAPVQRLATLVHGDRMLTAASLVKLRTTTICAADNPATEAGGISA
jgi:hypothetical protein